jgi:hypothetical protein
LDYDDPLAILIREHKADKQKRQEADIVSERRVEQRQAFQEKEQDDEDRRQREWLSSEQYRHAMQILADNIDDARKATTWAREQAAAEQQQAREALARAQRNALVVEDGRRVYFTRDGSRLYGEDDREITNEGTIAQAQRQRSLKPDATSYEDYAEKTKANRLAAEKAAKLRDTATRLDELAKRIKQGNLSPEDLAQARREQQNIVDGLPAEARAAYERLHAARKDDSSLTYRAADPAFTSAPALSTDFQQAVAATVTATAKEQGSRPQDDRRVPAYKAAPDY